MNFNPLNKRRPLRDLKFCYFFAVKSRYRKSIFSKYLIKNLFALYMYKFWFPSLITMKGQMTKSFFSILGEQFAPKIGLKYLKKKKNPAISFLLAIY